MGRSTLAERDVITPSALNMAIATTQSHVFDLDNCIGYSVQHVYADQAPTAKTFDSEATAELEVQDLTYTAVAAGVAGNEITIEYTDTGTAGDEVVTVDGTSIVIEIESGVSTATEVKAAFDAEAAAVALASVAVTGTGSNAQVTAAEAPLAGGVDSEIDLTANTITIPAHGLVTGTKVAASTDGVLPTGLSATDYWVIKVDADTIKLATNLSNATAGTAVDISAEGSGVHTLTPATASGNIFKLQKSNDQTNWVDISSMTVTNTTSATNTFFEVTDPTYRYMRAVYTPSAGQALIATSVVLVV